MTDPKPDKSLDGAYALGGTDDTRALYADWATTYDADFATEMDFLVPYEVARAFAETDAQGPVLDFGAGTGLVGKHLAAHGVGPIDAVDLSPEMLDVARTKGVYRNLIAQDILTTPIPGGYHGVVSSGTFTLGHVGPEGIAALLDHAAPGAQFALSINVQHFHAAGFAQTFDQLGPRIADLTLPEVRFYGPGATGPHKDDTGFIALFRKRA